MSDKQLRANQQAWQSQRPLYTENQKARTGKFIEGTDDLDPDPTAGLADGYVNVRIAGNRAATRALNAINAAVVDVPCIVGYNLGGSLVAYAVDLSEDVIAQLGINAAPLGTPQQTLQTNNTPVNIELLRGGRVLPSDLGGLNLFFEAYVPGGLDNGKDESVAAHVPASTNEHRWLLTYLVDGVPTIAALTVHSLSTNAGLLVSEARNFVLPGGSIRLFAVSLSNGQTAINTSTSRFVDLRRHHEREGGILSVVAGTGITVDNSNPANPIVNASGSGSGGGADIVIQDRKTAGTAGGTFTSGAWRTRDLNTIVTNLATVASLASNQITLPAGTYSLWASAPAISVDQHQTRWYNITAAAVQQSDEGEDMLGTSEYNNGDVAQTRSIVTGRFTVGVTTAFELQHWCLNTRATQGFGVFGNIAEEVYSIVMLWVE